MLEWIKRKLGKQPVVEPVDPDEALRALQMIASDAVFEDVWELMDRCASGIEAEVTDAVRAEQLGEYPLHAATIWLGYTLGADERTIADDLVDQLTRSVTWALGFEENTVLLGGALGAIESIGPDRRDAAAVAIFEAAGPARPRRYWLLLKVRSEQLMEVVVAALRDWSPAQVPEVADEDWVYSPTDANRMAGAFRQFSPDDFELARRYFDLDSPGAQFLVEALGATRSQGALELLQKAARDERPAVRDAAELWIRVIEAT